MAATAELVSVVAAHIAADYSTVCVADCVPLAAAAFVSVVGVYSAAIATSERVSVVAAADYSTTSQVKQFLDISWHRYPSRCRQTMIIEIFLLSPANLFYTFTLLQNVQGMKLGMYKCIYFLQNRQKCRNVVFFTSVHSTFLHVCYKE